MLFSGAMLDVGVLAEHGASGDIVSWMQIFGIKEGDFHAIVMKAIEQQMRPDWLTHNPQIVTGLATGDSAHAAGIRPYYLDDPKFSPISASGKGDDNAGRSEQEDSPGSKLSKAQTPTEAAEIVMMAILQRLSRSLQMPVEEIDRQRPLYSYGVDSLVAMETRNWIVKELKADISLFDILANMPIAAFAEMVVGKSKLAVI